MRHAFFLFILSILTITAGPIYQFNPISPYVANRGVTIFWGDTLAYRGKTNFLVDVTSFPAGVPLEFTKVSNGVVRAVTMAESNLINSLTLSNQNWQLTNAMLRARTNAFVTYDDWNEMDRKLRAIAKLVVDEINIVRTNPTAVLGARTYPQARTAITNAIAADQ